MVKGIYLFTYKPRKLVENYKVFPSKKNWLSGKGVPSPHTKKNFLCRFTWFRTWKKKNKKSVKMTQFCPDPPTPPVWNFTLFFLSEKVPYNSSFKEIANFSENNWTILQKLMLLFSIWWRLCHLTMYWTLAQAGNKSL